MPRVNIEEVAFHDPRIDALSVQIGFDALGPLARVWHFCYCRRSAVLSRFLIDGAARREGFAELLVRAELATTTEGDAYRVSGVEDRIKWLLDQDAKSARGVEAKRARHPGDFPAGKTPSLSNPNPLVVPLVNPGVSPWVNPGGNPPTPTPSPTLEAKDSVPTERSRPAPRRAAPKETKAKKEPAKRYHPKTAFPPGSTAREALVDSFPDVRNLDALLAQLDVEHRKRRPAGEAFTSVERWTRDRLAFIESKKRPAREAVIGKKEKEAPRLWEENLIIDDPEIRELRKAAHERQSRPCPLCRTVDTPVLLVRTDDFTGRAFVRQMICAECYEKRKKEEPCKSNA